MIVANMNHFFSEIPKAEAFFLVFVFRLVFRRRGAVFLRRAFGLLARPIRRFRPAHSAFSIGAFDARRLRRFRSTPSAFPIGSFGAAPVAVHFFGIFGYLPQGSSLLRRFIAGFAHVCAHFVKFSLNWQFSMKVGAYK